MNKTKTIYFLSAIVLIIGCYALNLSYSLFVQTDEKEIVNSYVPSLDYDLSVSSITVLPKHKYLVKEIINNTSDTIGAYYGLVFKTNSSNYNIQLIDMEYNTSYGQIDKNSSNDIYLYIENTGDTNLTIDFNLYKTYDTLDYDNFKTKYLSDNFDGTNIENYKYINDEVKYPLNSLSKKIPFDEQPTSLVYKIINDNIEKETTTYDDIHSLFPSSCSENECIIDTETYFYNFNELENTNDNTNLENSIIQGIYQAYDDYGKSYYYRGNVENNYINFAGYTWRIVRINGDGTVRLILDDTTNYILNGETTGDTYYYGNETFGCSNKDCMAYDYDDTSIKGKVDSFYKNYLIKFSDYIADEMFCNDITESVDNSKNNTDIMNAKARLETKPVLKCDENNTSPISRYTVDIENPENNITTNNKLNYPIGLITADEVKLSGEEKGYLSNSAYEWYTMTPSYLSKNTDETISPYIYSVSTTGALIETDISINNSNRMLGLRPVINLKVGIEYNNGDGTKTNPYTIK